MRKKSGGGFMSKKEEADLKLMVKYEAEKELRKINFEVEKRLSFLKGKKESIKDLAHKKFKQKDIYIYFFIVFIIMSGFIILGYITHPVWLTLSLILMVPGSFVITEMLWHLNIPTRRITKNDRKEMKLINRHKNELIFNNLYKKKVPAEIKKGYLKLYKQNIEYYKEIICI